MAGVTTENVEVDIVGQDVNRPPTKHNYLIVLAKKRLFSKTFNLSKVDESYFTIVGGVNGVADGQELQEFGAKLKGIMTEYRFVDGSRELKSNTCDLLNAIPLLEESGTSVLSCSVPTDKHDTRVIYVVSNNSKQNQQTLTDPLADMADFFGSWDDTYRRFKESILQLISPSHDVRYDDTHTSISALRKAKVVGGGTAPSDSEDLRRATEPITASRRGFVSSSLASVVHCALSRFGGDIHPVVSDTLGSVSPPERVGFPQFSQSKGQGLTNISAVAQSDTFLPLLSPEEREVIKKVQ
eukprot:CAMPEP_0184656900 /NCGR_PEP_ID=MMETSP0308-20130426/16830_1 /TAXON_ID=38269 /ORGANISM="Gloeochaete witrockiana, Strain SAG 46.84" /LENGTH=296 /DNA_ID=CAMNT_0027094217 /DNA_START=92 /DNA_END=982 /DNA_ORIENTATION=+